MKEKDPKSQWHLWALFGLLVTVVFALIFLVLYFANGSKAGSAGGGKESPPA